MVSTDNAQPYTAANDPGNMTGTYVTPNVLKCSDGKYRWMYELSMFSNPTIFITLCKIVGIALGFMFVLGVILGITDGNGMEGFISEMKMFLIVFVIMTGLILISYPITVLMLGGKYVVFFEMDEEGVTHYQAPRQFKKAQAIGVMSMLAGALTRNLSTFALGTYVSAVNSMTSTWSKVKSVKSVPKRNVIYVNELLFKNQVYAADEDYAFVDNFIRTHCPPESLTEAPVYPDSTASSQKAPRKMIIPAFALVFIALVLIFISGAAIAIRSYTVKRGPLHGAKIKKQVIWDNQDLKVTAKGLGYEKKDYQPPRYLTVEASNSGASDKTLTVETVAINGIMVEPDFELKVPAGSKSEKELIFTGMEFDTLAALSEIYTISLILKDGNTLSDIITLQTNLKEQPIYISTGEDDPVYEGDGYLVNYTSLYPSFSNFGPALEFYVENNTDKYVRIKSGGVLVNGSEADSRGFDEGILPHSCGYVRLALSLEQMERDDLLPLKNVQTEFEIYDPAGGGRLQSIPVSVDQ